MSGCLNFSTSYIVYIESAIAIMQVCTHLQSDFDISLLVFVCDRGSVASLLFVACRSNSAAPSLSVVMCASKAAINNDNQ